MLSVVWPGIQTERMGCGVALLPDTWSLPRTPQTRSQDHLGTALRCRVVDTEQFSRIATHGHLRQRRNTVSLLSLSTARSSYKQGKEQPSLKGRAPARRCEDRWVGACISLAAFGEYSVCNSGYSLALVCTQRYFKHLISCLSSFLKIIRI